MQQQPQPLSKNSHKQPPAPNSFIIPSSPTAQKMNSLKYQHQYNLNPLNIYNKNNNSMINNNSNMNSNSYSLNNNPYNSLQQTNHHLAYLYGLVDGNGYNGGGSNNVNVNVHGNSIHGNNNFIINSNNIINNSSNIINNPNTNNSNNPLSSSSV